LMRYDAGRASYFEVLEAQQQLFPAEDALAQTERDQLVAVVNLYKALGGGWDQREVRPVDQTASTDVSVHAQPIANQVSAPAPAIGSVEQQHAAPGGGK